MCHAGGVEGEMRVTDVSHWWCRRGELQMCHTGGVEGEMRVTDVSRWWC
jgi:cytochrome c5